MSTNLSIYTHSCIYNIYMYIYRGRCWCRTFGSQWANKIPHYPLKHFANCGVCVYLVWKAKKIIMHLSQVNMLTTLRLRRLLVLAVIFSWLANRTWWPSEKKPTKIKKFRLLRGAGRVEGVAAVVVLKKCQRKGGVMIYQPCLGDFFPKIKNRKPKTLRDINQVYSRFFSISLW